MKKVFLVAIILLLAVNLLHAKDMFSYSSKGNSVEIQFENKNDLSSETENTFTTIALPSEDIEIIIHDFTLSEFSDKGEFLKNVDQFDDARIEKVSSFTMRELRGHTLQIKTQIYNEKEHAYSKIERLDFEIVPQNVQSAPQYLSKAFYKLYPQLVDNFDQSYLAGLPVQPSKMLIICHQLLQNYIQDFIN